MITLRLSLTQNKYCTVISVYATSMNNSVDNINQFYLQLNETLGKITNSDKIILLGDFNAGIGSDCNTWGDFIWQFETGKSNSKG